MAWSFSNDRPIYMQMSERIVSSILTGEYGMGEKLPSVREFADIAAVNPNTVQRALGDLEAVGLIDNQRTTGKFVTQEEEIIAMAREKRGAALAAEFVKSMAALGYDIKQTLAIVSAASEKEDGKNG